MTPLSALSSSPLIPVSPTVTSVGGSSSAIRGTASASASAIQRPVQDPSEIGSSTGRREPENAVSPPEGRQAGQGIDGSALDEQQLKELQQLKARDREVRAHEAAHQAVGGQYSGAVSYTFQRGPDGNQYAIGGEVSIDISPIQGDPQATIEKMRIVRAAAMAPAQPSAQDRAVAAQAMQLMLQAQSELAAEQNQDNGSPSNGDEVPASPGAVDESFIQAGSSLAAESYRAVSGFLPADRSLIDAVA